MFFDIFKIEMREKYGHIEEESDYDDLQGIQENDEPVQSSVEENQGYICDQCKFIGKTEAGLKTHKTVKHGRKSGSCSLWVLQKWKHMEEKKNMPSWPSCALDIHVFQGAAWELLVYYN